jgi:hypothetical protein
MDLLFYSMRPSFQNYKRYRIRAINTNRLTRSEESYLTEDYYTSIKSENTELLNTYKEAALLKKKKRRLITFWE